MSDETGCRSPIIIVSPPPLVTVDQSFTFVINCTAMGIPTPQVVWRLNWGHVPDKCRQGCNSIDIPLSSYHVLNFWTYLNL